MAKSTSRFHRLVAQAESGCTRQPPFHRVKPDIRPQGSRHILRPRDQDCYLPLHSRIHARNSLTPIYILIGGLQMPHRLRGAILGNLIDVRRRTSWPRRFTILHVPVVQDSAISAKKRICGCRLMEGKSRRLRRLIDVQNRHRAVKTRWCSACTARHTGRKHAVVSIVKQCQRELTSCILC